MTDNNFESFNDDEKYENGSQNDDMYEFDAHGEIRKELQNIGETMHRERPPFERRETDRRQGDRRKADYGRPEGDRRKGDRRQGDRRQVDYGRTEGDRRQGERRQGDRRKVDRRKGDRRHGDRRAYSRRAKKKNIKEIIMWSILIVIVGGYFVVGRFLPDFYIAQGKKYMDGRRYQEAAEAYLKASQLRPYDDTLVYNRVLALSKLPKTAANQAALLEIAKMEDCSDASELADKLLSKMHNELIKSAGSNYIDNAPYNGRIVRWNNSKPITYYAENANMEQRRILELAFINWENSVDGKIKFRPEYGGMSSADITFHFVTDLRPYKIYEPKRVGVAFFTTVNGNILDKVDVYIKTVSPSGMPYPSDALLGVVSHEIGHSLGIWGHSINENDVMHYYGDFVTDYLTQKKISKRDVNTAKLLYDLVLPDEIDIALALDKNMNLDMIASDVLISYSGENFEFEIKKELEKLKQDKRNIQVWVDIAIGYAEKHQLSKSNFILENILPLVVDDVHNQFVIYYNLAVNNYKMHDYKKAAKYLTYAKYFGNDLEVQMLDAFIKFRMGEPGSEELIFALNEQNPRNIELALKVSEIYILKKDQRKARAVIDDLLKVNPDAIEDPRVKKYKVPMWRVFYKNK